MAAEKSTKHDHHIITVDGKKGRTYKVLIRKKVCGVNRTYAKTHRTLTEARADRDRVLSNASTLGRSRSSFAKVAGQYAAAYTGKDARFQQRLDHWVEVFSSTRLAIFLWPI
jgi:hypothetical protein